MAVKACIAAEHEFLTVFARWRLYILVCAPKVPLADASQLHLSFYGHDQHTHTYR